MGPIDVYLVRYHYFLMVNISFNLSTDILMPLFFCHSSQFEEKFEEIHGAEATPNLPSNSGLVENPALTMITQESGGKEIEMQGQDAHRECTNLNASQDFVSGIMKIVPSEIDVSSYVLLGELSSLPDNIICSFKKCFL